MYYNTYKDTAAEISLQFFTWLPLTKLKLYWQMSLNIALLIVLGQRMLKVPVYNTYQVLLMQCIFLAMYKNNDSKLIINLKGITHTQAYVDACIKLINAYMWHSVMS